MTRLFDTTTPRLIDSRDALDANAPTKRPFRGAVVGHYRPTGPNCWDPTDE